MRLVMSFSYDLFSYIFLFIFFVKKTELLCNKSVCADDLCGFHVVVEAMQHNKLI